MANWAFIPIRSGSKSIPHKNTKDFCGKPLVHWVIEALHNAKTIDYIVVAIDSKEQEDIVESYSSNKLKIYHRLPENSQDHSSTESVILEYLKHEQVNESDNMLLVQATSPFTTAKDIDNAMLKFKKTRADSMLSAVRVKRFFWHRNNPLNYNYKARPRRQDFDGSMMENGAFYINSVANILEHRNRLSGVVEIFEMPEYTGLEIDEPADWVLAEDYMKTYQPERLGEHAEIKLMLSDVDGVLTDAGMYYTENGDEIKKFSTYDGMGFKILQNAGIKVGIITGEARKLNAARADKLGLDYAYHGIADKLTQVSILCNELSIGLENVAYIGDDVNDIELLKNVGMPACPINAIDEIKSIPGILHLNTHGGSGVVREFAKKILLD